MARLSTVVACVVLGMVHASLSGLVANAQESAATTAGPADVSDHSPPLQPNESIPRAELEAFVDGVVAQAMATNHVAGVSLSIVQDQVVVLEKGYGFADLAAGRRVDPHATLFRIGSITKTFTWIAVLNAVAAGRIRVDDPINKHLPSDLQIPDGGFTEPVRLRHLMTHTPGFEDRALGHLFEIEASEVRPLARYLREERPLRVREPGRVHSYSNYGVGLAGAMLEQIHHRRWQDIIESDILEPLAMTRTTGREPYPSRADLPQPMPAPLAESLAHGYRWSGGRHQQQPFNFVTQGAPAGSMSSTAADMSRYMLALLGGGSLDGVPVFDATTARALQTPMSELPRIVGNWNAGFLATQLPGGFSAFGHGGDVVSFFSNLVIVPELRLGIFVTTNTTGGGGLTGILPDRIVDRFYASRPPAPSGSKELLSSANVYEGYYLPTRRPYAGLQAFLFRLLASRVSATPDGYLLVGLLGPPDPFVLTEERDVFKSVESNGFPQAVRFVRDAGRSIRIETPPVALERVAFLYQPPTLIVTAAATMILSLAALLGLRKRFDGWVMKPLAARIASVLELAASLTWLMSVAAFVVLAATVLPDETTLLYQWPMLSIRVFSAAALAASLLSAGMILLAPVVWRASRTQWAVWRKLHYTATCVVFGACAVLLTMWGALQPWNP